MKIITRAPRGFTLTELLVTLVIIGSLAGISYPAIRGGIRASHKSGCLSNLRQIGIGLEAYVQDNNGRMPDIEAGRRSRNEDIPVLETVLEEYLQTPEVFRCPADGEHFKKSGSSYIWNSTQSGVRKSNLSFFGTAELGKIPLVIDKEAWHPGAKDGSNFLYADMTASNQAGFGVSP